MKCVHSTGGNAVHAFPKCSDQISILLRLGQFPGPVLTLCAWLLCASSVAVVGLDGMESRRPRWQWAAMVLARVEDNIARGIDMMKSPTASALGVGLNVAGQSAPGTEVVQAKSPSATTTFCAMLHQRVVDGELFDAGIFFRQHLGELRRVVRGLEPTLAGFIQSPCWCFCNPSVTSRIPR